MSRTITTVTTEIDCPLFCEGGTGTISSSFTLGTATVTCCEKCNGGSFTIPVSRMDDYMRDLEPVYTYQHRDGLVVFA